MVNLKQYHEKLKTALVVLSGFLFMASAVLGAENGRFVAIQVEGVQSAQITVRPFEGARVKKPLIINERLFGSEELRLNIPEHLLPGEFYLNLNFRVNGKSKLYSTVHTFFAGNENFKMKIKPGIRPNKDILEFTGDYENTTYQQFKNEAENRKQKIILLEQLLSQYDYRDASVLGEADIEYKKRIAEFNDWTADQTAKHSSLYVSNLFCFQYLHPVNHFQSEDEKRHRKIEHYFDHINLNDTVLLRSRHFNHFMVEYVNLFTHLASTSDERDSLYVEAAKFACKITLNGHLKTHNWIMDYFLEGMDFYGIGHGPFVLQKHMRKAKDDKNKTSLFTRGKN